MKRTASLAAIVALAAAVALPRFAGAAEPKPSIEDPLNDANFLNDQGTGDGTFGDFAGPADATGFGDLLAVRFVSDKKKVYVHIETESAAQPSAGEGFRVRTNPDGAGGTYCLNFEIYFNGAQNDLATPQALFRDTCAGGDPVEAEALPSIFGGWMIAVPRAGQAALKKGATLAAPQAQTFLYSGSSYPTGVAGPYFDTTKVGTDYKLKN
jgi:hypothetical protein